MPRMGPLQVVGARGAGRAARQDDTGGPACGPRGGEVRGPGAPGYARRLARSDLMPPAPIAARPPGPSPARPRPASSPTARSGGRALALGALLCAGCAGDPVQQDAVAWHAGLSALMAENARIALRFQDLAADVKRASAAGPVKPEKVLGALSDDVVPAARALAERVPSARPATESFAALHDELGGVWDGRVSCYEGVLSAYKAEDRSALESAVGGCAENKLAEDWWVERANIALADHGLQLQLVPTAGAPAAP
jgi:hypothetical protein